MIPITGPNDSSVITRIEWSTSTSTVGPEVRRARAPTPGSRPRDTSARAPAATASAIWARTPSAALRGDHRADRRGLVERVAEHVAAGGLDEAVDELVVHVGVHVDPLDRAARLARVEERTVDVLADRVREVAVGAHVRRILAAELEPGADEPLAGAALDACGRRRPSR